MVFDVKVGKAASLVNAYTGKPMRVKLYVGPGGDPMLFAPGEFTPAAYTGDRRALAEFTTCLYTGKPLVLVHDEDAGWRCDGGFDPRRMRPVDEFLHFAAMRAGVSPYPLLPDRQRVSPVDEQPPPPPADDEPAQTDEALRVAEKVVAEHGAGIGLKRSPAVSMHVPGKRRRGAK